MGKGVKKEKDMIRRLLIKLYLIGSIPIFPFSWAMRKVPVFKPLCLLVTIEFRLQLANKLLKPTH